jgi:type VI secretion system secreted protein VgrG
VRAEERQATELVYTGRSTIPAMTAGATCSIEGHPHLADPRLLITEVTHEASQATMLAGSPGDERPYTNTFRAIPASRTYRPPRVTPKPRIPGVVTGIIDDPTNASSGQNAMIDDEGRYTVRFLFDTAAPGERRASRPIRMAQPHAGAGYGTHFPLKPGIEVLIAFVNGDPDRPIIAGAVPNPLTPSPVVASNAKLNRIVTVSGVRFDIKDA